MSELLKPPPIASAILNFFATQPDFPALAGDMAEEFQLRGQTSGRKAAERWFRREVFRNAWALTVREMWRTPVRTMLVALVCLLVINGITGVFFLLHLPRAAVLQLVLRQSFRIQMFVLQFVVSFAVARIHSRMLPGREWALTLMFTFVSACAVVFPAWYLLAALKVQLSPTELQFMLTAVACRLVGFWLGTLWSRYSRIRRSFQDPSQA